MTDRSEALIAQAQDYARGESERADRLATLARDILIRSDGASEAQIAEWGLILQQLEDAAGDLADPASDPLENAYATGRAAERERIRQLAIRQLAISHMTVSTKCASGSAIRPTCQCAARNPKFPFAALIEDQP